MSVSTCVKCDNEVCKEQLHFDIMARPLGWHLPDTWLTMVRGDTQLHSAWHFCSFACLQVWLTLKPEVGGVW